MAQSSKLSPSLQPPKLSRGALGWIKENLFNSIPNTLLTIAVFYLLYHILKTTIDWAFIKAIFSADSRNQCRAFMKKDFLLAHHLTLGSPQANEALSNGDYMGACWAFISKRWYQFAFGYYPQPLVWRPILAFELLVTALMPLLLIAPKKSESSNLETQGSKTQKFKTIGQKLADLLKLIGLVLFTICFPLAFLVALVLQFFPKARKGLLFLSVLYPFAAYLLIWGGMGGNSLWPYILALFILSFVGVLYVFKALALRSWDLLPLIFVPFIVAWIVYAGLHYDIVLSEKLGGFLLTLVIGITGIIFSLPIGIVLALARQSDMFVVRTLSITFIEVVRGVPLITILFVANVMLAYFLPPETNFSLLLRVLIMVTFFAATYIAEVIRGGLQGVDLGQTEAATSLGLTYGQSMRFIVLPQALKISIPGIVNTFIGLFKDTTLVAIIGLYDPLGIGRASLADSHWTGLATEVYVFVAVFFFFFCFAMSRYSIYLENRLKTSY